MPAVFIHSKEKLKKIVFQISEQAENILGKEFPYQNGKWISYVEEEVLALVYLKKDEVPFAQSRLNEYRSPFPGLICPQNISTSVAVNAREQTTGFFDNNKIKNTYGFRLERGAGIIISNHTQEMIVQGIGKSSLKNLNYSIDLAILYRPTEFDTETDIIQRVIRLMKKINTTGMKS